MVTILSFSNTFLTKILSHVYSSISGFKACGPQNQPSPYIKRKGRKCEKNSRFCSNYFTLLWFYPELFVFPLVGLCLSPLPNMLNLLILIVVLFFLSRSCCSFFFPVVVVLADITALGLDLWTSQTHSVPSFQVISSSIA